MKLLNGLEIAGFIKERQAKQVRSLKQSNNIKPRLAIVQLKDDPVINTYVRLKSKYGQDVGIEVDVYKIEQKDAVTAIKRLNSDDNVHGIIVQLPLANTQQTDEILKTVSPKKDVDGLGSTKYFDPATPMAIMWLLAGYNVDLRQKDILLIGRGKLVGKPLEKMLKASNYNVRVAGRDTKDLTEETKKADIIITATGSPAIIYSNMIKEKAVIVDAGVASEDGKTVGDVADEVYKREDLTITPKKGGVGPLTVCALFDNVIKAARLLEE